jgi:hypothetical protein
MGSAPGQPQPVNRFGLETRQVLAVAAIIQHPSGSTALDADT